MIIITAKDTNVYLMSGEHMDYLDNGYPRLIDENTAFPTEMVNVYKDVTIPDGIIPGKYYYKPLDGFTANVNYVEPNKYNIPEETYKTIQDDTIADLISLGVISK